MLRWQIAVVVLVLLTSCQTFPAGGSPVYFECPDYHTNFKACHPIHPDAGTQLRD